MKDDSIEFSEETAKVDLLRQIRLFADVLDLRQLEALAAKCRIVLHPTGSLLMSQGDFGTSMFAILAGTVLVSVEDERGHRAEVARLGSGQVVGEMSLMTGARRTATVTAATDVRALEITKVALEAVLAHSPDLIDSFAFILAKRQSDLDRIAAESRTTLKDEIVGQMRRFFSGIFGGGEPAER